MIILGLERRKPFTGVSTIFTISDVGVNAGVISTAILKHAIAPIETGMVVATTAEKIVSISIFRIVAHFVVIHDVRKRHERVVAVLAPKVIEVRPVGQKEVVAVPCIDIRVRLPVGPAIGTLIDECTVVVGSESNRQIIIRCIAADLLEVDANTRVSGSKVNVQVV